MGCGRLPGGRMNRAVINGKTGSIECPACGASEKMRVPATIEEFCEQGAEFGRKHEDCQPVVSELPL